MPYVIGHIFYSDALSVVYGGSDNKLIINNSFFCSANSQEYSQGVVMPGQPIIPAPTRHLIPDIIN